VPDPVQDALKAHAAAVDQTVLRFLSDLEHVIAIAQGDLQSAMLTGLTLDTEHRVTQTLANQKLIRRIPTLWQQALDDAGLEKIVDRYMAAFPQQIPAFRTIIETVNQQAKEPLPLPNFTAADQQYFKSLQLSAGSDVASVVENAATGVITKTAFSLGTIAFKDLVQRITDSTDASKAQAETLADTSLMGFYRSVAANAYDKIQEKVDRPILYDWMGPNDKVTSAKCSALLAASKKQPLTREEIDQLRPYPGSPGPVFVYGFHYNCRHSFVISTRMSLQT
jgi:hypothetical protein